jgi:hypothetical protein
MPPIRGGLGVSFSNHLSWLINATPTTPHQAYILQDILPIPFSSKLLLAVNPPHVTLLIVPLETAGRIIARLIRHDAFHLQRWRYA